MNTARIKIEGVGDSAGTAATALDPQQTGVVATGAAGGGREVVNSIALTS